MAYELHSRTGAIIERHPDLPSVVERLSDTFVGSLVTTDAYRTATGDIAHRVLIGDQLYGVRVPVSNTVRKD